VTSPIPPYLPVAIGAADLTLNEQVGAYSVFPNDGIRLAPHAIRRVSTRDDIPMLQPQTDVSPVIDEATARTMMIFLREVTRSGTGAAAAQLKHPLGGKTGTTNDYTDAWFIGFSPSVTCGVWVGFDDPAQTLGKKETGAQAALPIWMDFMRAAIADKPDEQFAMDKEPEQPAATTATTGKAVAASPPAADVKKPEVKAAATVQKTGTAGADKTAASAKPAASEKPVAATAAAGDTAGAVSGAPASHPTQSAPSAPPHSASEPRP
jgi:penicillin-binding protein 1A